MRADTPHTVDLAKRVGCNTHACQKTAGRQRIFFPGLDLDHEPSKIVDYEALQEEEKDTRG